MKKSRKKTEIEIDLSKLYIPISIIIGSLIISVSILYGFKSGNTSKSSSQNEASSANYGSGSNVGNGDDQGDTPQAGNTIAKTTINDDPYLGDKSKAKIAIVEFSDYECPFCKRHHQQTFDQIVKEYVDTGKAILVYRDFPLSFHDPLATTEAIAAECVQDLEGDKKYFEYSKLIFDTTNSNGKGLEKSKLYDLAKNIGVDNDKFTQCLDSEKFKDEVAKDIEDGSAAGVTGTPGFIIGKLGQDGTVEGVIIAGAYPFSEFQKVLDEQLAK